MFIQNINNIIPTDKNKFLKKNWNIFINDLKIFVLSKNNIVRYKMPRNESNNPRTENTLNQYLNIRMSFAEKVFINSEISLTVLKFDIYLILSIITGYPAVIKHNFAAAKNDMK